MGQIELTQRMLCSEARVDSKRVRNGNLTESDWGKIAHATGRLADAPIWIDDNPNLTIMEIRSKARRLKSRVGDLGLIVVDYLQLMTGRANAESRQVEVSEISRGLKILASRARVPGHRAVQPAQPFARDAGRQAPDARRPRESGCLTADTRITRADTGHEVTLGDLLASGEQDVPIWTLNENYRLVRGQMTKVFPSGIKTVYELRLSSGRTVKASGNHPFLALEGWFPLEKLDVGDCVAVPRSGNWPASVGRDEVEGDTSSPRAVELHPQVPAAPRADHGATSRPASVSTTSSSRSTPTPWPPAPRPGRARPAARRPRPSDVRSGHSSASPSWATSRSTTPPCWAPTTSWPTASSWTTPSSRTPTW